MIHQLIFAGPKPGMTDQEFQDYWLRVHAVKYASKITQIKKYMIDTTIASKFASDLPYKGIAEIWLENEKDQVESLQSDAFLQGARPDEPNWAAFWLTIGLDTDAHVLLEGPPLTNDPKWVKLVVLNKRKEGMTLKDYRAYSLETHGEHVMKLPGLRRYMQCHAKDGLYVLGESRFDAVWQLWFDNEQALEQALTSEQYAQKIKPDMEHFVELKYVFNLVVKEHWIIGPNSR